MTGNSDSGHNLQLLARVLRRRFGRTAGRSFVLLAAVRPVRSRSDITTQRLQVLSLDLAPHL
jgi:hypothetical protein